MPVGGNQTLIAAAGEDGIPSPAELMLSGHIHSFEAMNYGGDLLEPTPAILN